MSYKTVNINKLYLKVICICIISIFICTVLFTDLVSIKQTQASILGLPEPTALLRVSSEYDLPILKGIKIHPDNPFKFDLLIEEGQSKLSTKQLQRETDKIIKYFLASITVPESDLWVNLSPYERDRVLPVVLSRTDMGQDMLGQDYILKQIASSLTHPDTPIGSDYWSGQPDSAEAESLKKIWIVPEKSVVYEDTNKAFVETATLAVMCEDDYLANKTKSQSLQTTSISKLIPEISKDVNNGKNFARLRQMYYSLILGVWFKQKLKDSIVTQVYADQNKTPGITAKDSEVTDKIYDLYIESFKKGVYNLTKKMATPTSKNRQQRFFSGGLGFENIFKTVQRLPIAKANSAIVTNPLNVTIELNQTPAASTQNNNQSTNHSMFSGMSAKRLEDLYFVVNTAISLRYAYVMNLKAKHDHDVFLRELPNHILKRFGSQVSNEVHNVETSSFSRKGFILESFDRAIRERSNFLNANDKELLKTLLEIDKTAGEEVVLQSVDFFMRFVRALYEKENYWSAGELIDEVLSFGNPSFNEPLNSFLNELIQQSAWESARQLSENLLGYGQYFEQSIKLFGNRILSIQPMDYRFFGFAVSLIKKDSRGHFNELLTLILFKYDKAKDWKSLAMLASDVLKSSDRHSDNVLEEAQRLLKKSLVEIIVICKNETSLGTSDVVSDLMRVARSVIELNDPMYVDLVIEALTEQLRLGDVTSFLLSFIDVINLLHNDVENTKLELLDTEVDSLVLGREVNEFEIKAKYYVLKMFLDGLVTKKQLNCLFAIVSMIHSRDDFMNFMLGTENNVLDKMFEVVGDLDFDLNSKISLNTKGKFWKLFAQKPIVAAMSLREISYLLSIDQKITNLPQVHVSRYDVYALPQALFLKKRRAIDDPSSDLNVVDAAVYDAGLDLFRSHKKSTSKSSSAIKNPFSGMSKQDVETNYFAFAAASQMMLDYYAESLRDSGGGYTRLTAYSLVSNIFELDKAKVEEFVYEVFGDEIDKQNYFGTSDFLEKLPPSMLSGLKDLFEKIFHDSVFGSGGNMIAERISVIVLNAGTAVFPKELIDKCEEFVRLRINNRYDSSENDSPNAKPIWYSLATFILEFITQDFIKLDEELNLKCFDSIYKAVEHLDVPFNQEMLADFLISVFNLQDSSFYDLASQLENVMKLIIRNRSARHGYLNRATRLLDFLDIPNYKFTKAIVEKCKDELVFVLETHVRNEKWVWAGSFAIDVLGKKNVLLDSVFLSKCEETIGLSLRNLINEGSNNGIAVLISKISSTGDNRFNKHILQSYSLMLETDNWQLMEELLPIFALQFQRLLNSVERKKIESKVNSFTSEKLTNSYAISIAYMAFKYYLQNKETNKLKWNLGFARLITNEKALEYYKKGTQLEGFDIALDLLMLLSTDELKNLIAVKQFWPLFGDDPVGAAMSARETGYLMSIGKKPTSLPRVHVSRYDVYALPQTQFLKKRKVIDDPSLAIKPVDETVYKAGLDLFNKGKASNKQGSSAISPVNLFSDLTQEQINVNFIAFVVMELVHKDRSQKHKDWSVYCKKVLSLLGTQKNYLNYFLEAKEYQSNYSERFEPWGFANLAVIMEDERLVELSLSKKVQEGYHVDSVNHMLKMMVRDENQQYYTHLQNYLQKLSKLPDNNGLVYIKDVAFAIINESNQYYASLVQNCLELFVKSGAWHTAGSLIQKMVTAENMEFDYSIVYDYLRTFLREVDADYRTIGQLLLPLVSYGHFNEGIDHVKDCYSIEKLFKTGDYLLAGHLSLLLDEEKSDLLAISCLESLVQNSVNDAFLLAKLMLKTKKKIFIQSLRDQLVVSMKIGKNEFAKSLIDEINRLGSTEFNGLGEDLFSPAGRDFLYTIYIENLASNVIDDEVSTKINELLYVIKSAEHQYDDFQVLALLEQYRMDNDYEGLIDELLFTINVSSEHDKRNRDIGKANENFDKAKSILNCMDIKSKSKSFTTKGFWSLFAQNPIAAAMSAREIDYLMSIGQDVTSLPKVNQSRYDVYVLPQSQFLNKRKTIDDPSMAIEPVDKGVFEVGIKMFSGNSSSSAINPDEVIHSPDMQAWIIAQINRNLREISSRNTEGMSIEDVTFTVLNFFNIPIKHVTNDLMFKIDKMTELFRFSGLSASIQKEIKSKELQGVDLDKLHETINTIVVETQFSVIKNSGFDFNVVEVVDNMKFRIIEELKRNPDLNDPKVMVSVVEKCDKRSSNLRYLLDENISEYEFSQRLKLYFDADKAVKRHHKVLIEGYIAQKFLDEKPMLNPKQEELIRKLSRTVGDAIKSSEKQLNIKGKLTIREEMRFNKNFSRFFLRDKDTAVANLFKTFALTAWTVYGRYIEPENREEFGRILNRIFISEEFRDLFGYSDIASGKGIDEDNIVDLFDFGTLDEEIPSELTLPTEKRLYAAIERSRECEMPLFSFIPDNMFSDVAFRTLNKIENAEVYPIDFSAYSRRGEFYSSDLPIDGQIKKLKGVFERLLDRAEKLAYDNPINPKQVYFLGNNVDAAPGVLRMALHSVLLERKVIRETSDDESGETVTEKLPSNFNILLPKSAQAEIDDESFMNRGAGSYLTEPDNEEIIQYLIRESNVDTNTAKQIIELYLEINKQKKLTEKIGLQDMVQIAFYVVGRIESNGGTYSPKMLIEEAALHLTSKYSFITEKKEIDLIKQILNVSKMPKLSINVLDKGRYISFSGLKVKVDKKSDFGKHLSENHSQGSFENLLQSYLSKPGKPYCVTSVEIKTMCLMARVYQSAPTDFIYLLGKSGVGKTRITDVLQDILGVSKLDYTINRDTRLSMLRGGLGLAEDGSIELVIPEYWKILENDGVIFNYNEGNTNIGLMYWLWPIISGRKYRLGFEYAVSNDDDETKNNIFEKKVFGKHQLHVVSGNPGRRRRGLPEIFSNNIAATYVIERTPSDTENLIKSMFSSFNQAESKFKLKPRTLKQKTKLLNDVFTKMQKALADDKFVIKREITPRSILRFLSIFYSRLNQGYTQNEAFNFALYMVFVYMWNDFADMKEAAAVINQELGTQPKHEEVLAFIKEFPLDIPLLIFTNGSMTFDEVRKTVVPDEAIAFGEFVKQDELDNEIDVYHEVDLSNFHKNRELVGGMSKASQEGHVKNLISSLTWLNLQARLYPSRSHYVWMTGYLHLNKQIAPGLNEYLQDGALDLNGVFNDDLKRDLIAQIKATANIKDNGSVVYESISQEYYKETGRRLPDNPKDLDTLEVFSESEQTALIKLILATRPNNLLYRIQAATGEKIEFHTADLDRSFPVNVSKPFSKEWFESYVDKELVGTDIDADKTKDIKSYVYSAYELFEQQHSDMLYPHNRFLGAEFRAFIEEIKKSAASNKLDDFTLRLYAYHMLAMGLQEVKSDPTNTTKEARFNVRDYRREYAQSIGLDIDNLEYTRRFEQGKPEVYFVITVTNKKNGRGFDVIRKETNYSSFKTKKHEYYDFETKESEKIYDVRLQAPLQILLAQEVSALIFYEYDIPVSFEGDPGGGKTTSIGDLAAILGARHFEEGMYKGIKLSNLLGSLSIGRDDKFFLTSLQKDKNSEFLIPFLRFYESGGLYAADEGAVGKGAAHLLRWMVNAASKESIDLGDYIPGLKGGGYIIRRNPDFRFYTTQNIHYRTGGRKPLPYEVDMYTAKVRVDSNMTVEDALKLIDFYLEDEYLDPVLKKEIAELHVALKDLHPYKHMISPRDLIEMVKSLKRTSQQGEDVRQAAYRAINATYVELLLDDGTVEEVKRAAPKSLLDRHGNRWKDFVKSRRNATVIELIKFFVPHFENVDYSDKLPDFDNTNIDELEVKHWGASHTYDRKMNAIEYAFESDRPVMINSELGARPVEFMKAFCERTGRQFDVFDGSPGFRTKYALQGDSFEFEDEFDDEGRSRVKPDKKFVHTKGFYAKYMVPADQLDNIPEEEKVERVIAINNVEAPPASELVKFNPLYASNEEWLVDPETGELTKFVKPPWIHFVNITSNLNAVTAPFANRHKKIGLRTLSDDDELYLVYSQLYPNVTLKEMSLLRQISRSAELACAEKNGLFEVGYGFSQYDFEKLIKLVQFFKQIDGDDKYNDHPFWYVFRVVRSFYMRALTPEDRVNFKNQILAKRVLQDIFPKVPASHLAAYYDHMETEIIEAEPGVKHIDYPVEIPISEFDNKTPVILPNGIVLKLHDEGEDTNIEGREVAVRGVTVVTPAHVYFANSRELENGKDFSDGSVNIKYVNEEGKGRKIVLTLQLVKSINGVELARDQSNLDFALPIEELPVEDYMYQTNSTLESLSSFLYSAQSTKTLNGKTVPGDLMILAGETGTGKSTVIRMLSRIWGVPFYQENPYHRMPESKLTVSLAMNGDIYMQQSNFLASVAKIDNKPANMAHATSNRMIVLLDEANATRDAWWKTDALARGERFALYETATGKTLRAGLHPETIIVKTQNYAEQYGGVGRAGNRYVDPLPIMTKETKVYVDEPLKTFSDKELREIQKALYDRGKLYFSRKEALSDVTILPEQGGYTEVKEEPFIVKDIGKKPVRPLHQVYRELDALIITSKDDDTDEAEAARQREQKRKKIQDDIDQTYSFNEEEFKKSLQILEDFINVGQSTKQESVLAFMDKLFNGLVAGIGQKQISDEDLERTMTIAAEIDVELEKTLRKYHGLCKKKKRTKLELKAVLGMLDKFALDNDIFLEELHSKVFHNMPFASCKAFKIKERRKLQIEVLQLETIVGSHYLEKLFDNQTPEVFILDRPPSKSVLGYFDGRNVIVSSMEEWREHEVAAHEFGHAISDKVGKLFPSVGNVLSLNVEMFSMLFPIIYLEDPFGYIKTEYLDNFNLVRLGGLKSNDAYAMASKDNLNALLQWFKKKQPDLFAHLKPISEMFYEEDRISDLVDALSAVDDKSLKEAAVGIFLNPSDYYKDIKPGVYHRKVQNAVIDGLTYSINLEHNLNFKPRLEVEIVGEDLEVDPPETPPDEDDTEFIEDDSGERSNADFGFNKKKPEISNKYERRFMSDFAPERDDDDYDESRYVDEGGSELNPDAIAQKRRDEYFIDDHQVEEDEDVALNVMIVLDTSGSVRGRPEVVNALNEKIRHLSELMMRLIPNNPDLNISIASITEEMNIVLPFKDWINARSPIAKREVLEKALEEIWKVGTNAGLVTDEILKKLSQTEFPSSPGKQTYNFVDVISDWEECGTVGDKSKENIINFTKGEYIPDGVDEDELVKHSEPVYMVFSGVNLPSTNVENAKRNYPLFLNQLGQEDSEDTYLEGFCNMMYLLRRDLLVYDMAQENDLSKILEQYKQTSSTVLAVKDEPTINDIGQTESVFSGLSQEELEKQYILFKVGAEMKLDYYVSVGRLEIAGHVFAKAIKALGQDMNKSLENYLSQLFIQKEWNQLVRALGKMLQTQNGNYYDVVLMYLEKLYANEVFDEFQHISKNIVKSGDLIFKEYIIKIIDKLIENKNIIGACTMITEILYSEAFEFDPVFKAKCLEDFEEMIKLLIDKGRSADSMTVILPVLKMNNSNLNDIVFKNLERFIQLGLWSQASNLLCRIIDQKNQKLNAYVEQAFVKLVESKELIPTGIVSLAILNSQNLGFNKDLLEGCKLVAIAYLHRLVDVSKEKENNFTQSKAVKNVLTSMLQEGNWELLVELADVMHDLFTR